MSYSSECVTVWAHCQHPTSYAMSHLGNPSLAFGSRIFNRLSRRSKGCRRRLGLFGGAACNSPKRSWRAGRRGRHVRYDGQERARRVADRPCLTPGSDQGRGLAEAWATARMDRDHRDLRAHLPAHAAALQYRPGLVVRPCLREPAGRVPVAAGGEVSVLSEGVTPKHVTLNRIFSGMMPYMRISGPA
jgi:hypothetical protein